MKTEKSESEEGEGEGEGEGTKVKQQTFSTQRRKGKGLWREEKQEVNWTGRSRGRRKEELQGEEGRKHEEGRREKGREGGTNEGENDCLGKRRGKERKFKGAGGFGKILCCWREGGGRNGGREYEIDR